MVEAEQVTERSGLEELKKNLKSKNIIFGSERVLKQLKLGKIGKIFIASNAKKEIVDDLSYYAKFVGAEIMELDIPNDELGIFCKKNFSVSVIGLLK